MKVWIKKNYHFIFLFFLILSYIFVIYKYEGNDKIFCQKNTVDDNFEKKEEITIIYKNDEIKKIKRKELFSSTEESILSLKRAEYQNKGYKLKEEEHKIIVYYETNEVESLKDALKMIYEVGYECVYN